MSSRDELKARSVKRMMKKQQRVLLKKTKADDPENRTFDYIQTMLPVPTKRTTKRKLTRKKKGDEIDTTPRVQKHANPLSIRKSADQLKTDFSGAAPFERRFWKGVGGEEQPSDELKTARKDIGVLVKGNLPECPAPVSSLTDESLPASFAKVCAAQNITAPSIVQKQCWPAILYGANVLGIAPTGSGKTLAYCMPMIPHIEAQILEQQKVHSKRKVPVNNRIISPMALVLVPTRELAVQVVSVLKPFKRQMGINSGAVYGGLDKNDQLQKLKAAYGEGESLHVLVATPGRLEDFLYTASAGNSLQLEVSRVTYLVIDEADRMLTMGFMDQLNAISACIRPDRQTVLFSATFPGRLREAAEVWVRDAVIVRCNAMEFADHSKVALQEQEQQDQASGPEEDDDAASSNGDEAAEEEGQPSKKKVKFEAPTAPGADNAAVIAVAGDTSKTSSLTISHTVQQKIHVCASHKKPRLLLKYVTSCREAEKAAKVRQAGPMIIFCNKIKTLKFVHDFLKRQEVRADALHGQLAQHVREAILANFKAVSVEELNGDVDRFSNNLL